MKMLLFVHTQCKGSGHDMLDALKDLKVKTASWTPLYYGNIKVRML